MERFIILVSFAHFASTYNASVNSMIPKMFHLDPFDSCIEGDIKYAENVYCIADVYIKSNKSSPTWNLIETISKPWKTQYRHDHLVYGVCLQRCKEVMAKFDGMTRRKFMSQKPENFKTFDIDPFAFQHAIKDKFMYEDVVNECINYEMRKKFDVEAFSEVQYCEVSGRRNEIGDAEIIFVIVIGFYALLIVLSTMIEIGVINGYIKNPHSLELLSAFSLISNYKHFVKKPESPDLEFLHSIKFLSMVLVIWGHCIMIHSVLPFSNPEFIESKYQESWTILVLNGTMIIQSFFFLGGFLLSIQFSKRIGEGVKVANLVTAVFYRLVRILPFYAFIIFFNSTWLIRFGDGPMWRRTNELEKSFCTKNYLANFLFVNNFISSDEPCVQQAWFLAADFQLFMVGLICLFAYFKFQQLKKALITLFFVAPTLLHGLIIYQNHFHGIFIASPESQRTLFWHDEMYQKLHIATHANADCYLTGIVAGLLYLQMEQRKTNLMKFKVFRVIFYLTVPCGVGLLLTAKIFYAGDIGPLLCMAAYGALARKLWGIISMILVFGCAHDKANVIAKLLSHKFLTNLGKLTFVVFLTHMNVIKIFYAETRVPYDLTIRKIMETTLISIIMTYLISFVLYLTIEQPVSKILRSCFTRFTQVSSNSHDDSTKNVAGLSLHHRETSLKA